MTTSPSPMTFIFQITVNCADKGENHSRKIPGQRWVRVLAPLKWRILAACQYIGLWCSLGCPLLADEKIRISFFENCYSVPSHFSWSKKKKPNPKSPHRVPDFRAFCIPTRDLFLPPPPHGTRVTELSRWDVDGLSHADSLEGVQPTKNFNRVLGGGKN